MNERVNTAEMNDLCVRRMRRKTRKMSNVKQKPLGMRRPQALPPYGHDSKVLEEVVTPRKSAIYLGGCVEL